MSYLSRLIHAALAKKAEHERALFDKLAADPLKTQREWLFSTLRREAGTAFGRDFHFASIRSVADFRRHVPILKYENLEPYIERVKNGETEALFHRQKVLMLSMTSGTVGARKYLPVTKRFVKTHQRGWYLWGLGAFSAYPHLCMGAKIGLAGNPDEFRSPANIACGSISGLTAKLQNPFIRRTCILPADTWHIQNSRTKSYMAWRFGLNAQVGMWLTPNPSTHLALAKFGDQNREQLIEDVESGRISEEGIPNNILKINRKLILPNPLRAKELREILNRTGHLRPKDVWPGLDLIGCWLGGSVRSYLRFFPEYFGNAAVRDIGLIASEARMTIPLEDETASGVLEVSGTFFEFIPVEEIDSSQPTVLESHELEEGREYYVLLTTSGGLYRYHIEDVVRCTGWHLGTPTLEFLHKGSRISNLTGEKLSEHQVVTSVEAAFDRLELRFQHWSLAPCWNEGQPDYALFVERQELPSGGIVQQFATELDRQLREANYEYNAKRLSGRLGEARVESLPEGTWTDWDRERLRAQGSAPEQYKHPYLITDLDFSKRWQAGNQSMETGGQEHVSQANPR